MLETIGKQSVRITLLNSGLSPPIFILASFTDPPWEPQEMKHVGVRMVDSGPYSVDSTLAQVEYMFWRRFDIYPGVWNYKYRIGLNDWTICDHNAETETSSSGEAYNVLRVAATRAPLFQSPAALPIFGNETSSIQGSRQKSSSDSDSWQSTREDPLEPLDSQQSSASCPSFVTNPFSLSRTRVVGEGSNTSDHPEHDEEQHLPIPRATEAITQSSSLSGNEASVQSKDQDSFFAICWQSLIAWVFFLFAKTLWDSWLALVVIRTLEDQRSEAHKQHKYEAGECTL